MHVSVIIPTRNEVETVADVIAHCRDAGAGQMLVVDSRSSDGTVAAAEAAGAHVLDADALFAELGPAVGKGDALWRALPHTDGEVVAFLDGDVTVFDDLLPQLVEPLTDPSIRFSKGNISRLDANGHRVFGRVSQFTAAPLLRAFFPELADLDEPLSGQIAARRDDLMRLAFEPDYGLEIGMLVDAFRTHGRNAIAHPECGRILNPQQSDADLAGMADQVARALLTRYGLEVASTVAPRPPHAPAD